MNAFTISMSDETSDVYFLRQINRLRFAPANTKYGYNGYCQSAQGCVCLKQRDYVMRTTDTKQQILRMLWVVCGFADMVVMTVDRT